MSKTFRPWDIEQRWLLPPSVQDLVPAGHVAHFVRETVREALDLSAIFAAYTEERGYPPYHPAMMVALLLYAYSREVYSSRKMAQGCEERLDFMAVTAMNRPDFRTIATFRRRHLKALGDLFVQVLKLCQAAGLVKLGHVALDGTKMKANAGLHKAMSYGRMREAEKKLAAEVSAWFARAEATDAAEDGDHGADRSGDEMPDWVADKAARLERIGAAKAALEAEAQRPPAPHDDGPGPSSGMMKNGKPQRTPEGAPPDRAQRNFTNPDSRIQPTRGGGVLQGCNAVIAVDGAHQIIIAQRLQTSPADGRALKPLLASSRKVRRAKVLRANPQEVSADAGFGDEANLVHLARRRISAFMAPGRARHGEAHAAGRRRWRQGSRIAAMYDPLVDLTSISRISTSPLALLVKADAAPTSVSDVVAWSHSRPGGLNYGSSGVGGIMYNAGEIFRNKTGADMTHVPFRGGPDAVTALISGQVQVVFAIMSDVMGQVAAKTVRPLAVTTATRSPLLPDVPTMMEQGVKDYDIVLWNGLFGPPKLPKPILDALSAIMLRMPDDPATRQALARLGSTPVVNTPDQFHHEMEAEVVRWEADLKGVARK